jgi:hypothetical protein
VLVGGWLVVRPLLSVYNCGQRIKRAQRLVIVAAESISASWLTSPA